LQALSSQAFEAIDLVFDIGYEDDLEKAERVLNDIVDTHEAILENPEPTVRLNELGESSIKFIVRPWVKTDDYWETYWDLMKTVKLRFDEEGISIPYPQRSVHITEKG
jgi:small conductance mechanosensitive channel